MASEFLGNVLCRCRMPRQIGKHCTALIDAGVGVMLAEHHLLSGPRRDPTGLPRDQEVVTATHTDRQSTVLVRTGSPVLDPAWTVEPIGLEDLVLAYMREAGDEPRPRRDAVLRVQR